MTPADAPIVFVIDDDAGIRASIQGLLKSVGLHLPHHVPALDLHCYFTRPELSCYLLVEHAENNQAHHLTLARSE